MARIDLDTGSGNIRISDSNSLWFVRTDSQSGFKQNKDDYLIEELVYPNFNYDFCYFQKFKIADDILNQFLLRTDNADISKVELFNAQTDVLDSDLTGDLTDVTPGGSFTEETYGALVWYNHTIDTSLLGGYYYLLITLDNSETYESMPFYIFHFDDEDGVKIQWRNDVSSKYDDGIYQDGTYLFETRLDARIYDMEFGDNSENYVGFNETTQILKGRPLRSEILEYGPVHWFVAQLLNNASQHDYFYVNGKRYVADGGIEDENSTQDSKRTLIHSGTLKMTLKNYQRYVQLIEAEPAEIDGIKHGDDDDDFILHGGDADDIILYN